MVLPREPDTVKPRFRGRLRRYEIGLLAVFAAMSMWVVAIDLWQVIAHGWVWTGTDGFYIVDQMQYLAWIQSASHHVFSANLFVLRGTPADYFQPAVAISGAITALGVAPWLALLLWKPVAVVAIFFGIRAYIARTVPSGPGRAVALTLAGCEEVLREANRLAPGLAEGRIVEWRVGLRPLSTTGRPLVGGLPGVQHVHVATGHGANGLLLGPYSGMLLAESLATGRPPAELALLAVQKPSTSPPGT